MGRFRNIAVILFFAFVFAVEELPVSIKGDSLIYNDNLINASGNASLVYNQYSISADKIQIDTKTNLIQGNGHVLIKQGDEETLPADGFEFDMNNEQLKVADVDFSFRPAVAKQDIYVRFLEGKNLRDQVGQGKKDILDGQECRLTTCDLDDPHYWVSAKEFLYYPDDKVVAYHMTAHFWFSPLPLGYTPYYVFYLGKRKVIFKFPKIGSNTVEGNFIKTETMYFIDDYNEGSVFVDTMSLKGNGKGWYHKYNFGEPGSFYYYNVTEQDLRPKRDTNIVKWHQELSPSIYDKVTIDHRYKKTYLLPSGFDDRMEDSLGYTYREDKTALNMNYNFREDYQSFMENQNFASNLNLENQKETISWQKDYRRQDQYRYEAINIDHSIQLDNEWLYHVNPVYSRTKARTNPFDERLSLAMDLELTPQEKKYYQSMTIHSNWFYDPDGDRVTLDNTSDEFVEKTPEVTVKAIRYDFGGVTENEALFSVDTTYTSGLIREAKYFSAYNLRRVYSTTKFSADANIFKTYPLGIASLTLMRGYKQTGYGSQDAHYQISDKPYLQADWCSFIKNRLDYEDTRGEGNSPFFYDDPAITAAKKGSHTLSFYQRKQWSGSFFSAKDFRTNIFDDYLYNLTIDPWEDTKYTFVFASGKNYYTNIYRDFTAGIAFHPVERHFYRLNYTKDINNNYDENPLAGKFKSASSEVDFTLGLTYAELGYWNFWESEWHFIIKNMYDFNTQYINLQSLSLGKDLHCWYMRYNFTPIRKEWYIAFTLKAFPEEPFNISGNEDRDFSFEAFSDTLKSEPVKRYD